jgi:hypothetical protein
MRKSNLEERINNSFKAETPDILDRIKSSDQFYVPEKDKKFDFNRFFNKRLSYSLASVFVLALVLFSVLSSGPSIDSVVASTVTIDINPSIEITLNDDDEVINIRAINPDGELLIDRNINFKGLSLDKTIEVIIAAAIEKGFIVDDTEDNIILIDVSSTQLEIKERVEAILEVKITAEMTKAAKAIQVRRESRQELTEDEEKELTDKSVQFQLSAAKLFLINKIIVLDDSYTVEALKNTSIRELYNILNTLVPEEDYTPGNNNNTTGNR